MIDKKYDIMILSGGFDPIHKGHVRMFKAAKNMAHKVILGLNSDSWLVRKKGKTFMNWAERAEILRGFKYIDEVVAFNDDDEEQEINAEDILEEFARIYKNDPELQEMLGQDPDKYTLEEKLSINQAYKKGGGVAGLAEIIDDESDEEEEQQLDNNGA